MTTYDSYKGVPLDKLAEDVKWWEYCNGGCPMSLSKRLWEIHEETRWVPVSERLPENGDHVLVYGICCNELYDDDTEMSVDAVSWGSVDHSYCTGTCYYGVWYKDITHWKRIQAPEGL
jgi:hypothetical protein